MACAPLLAAAMVSATPPRPLRAYIREPGGRPIGYGTVRHVDTLAGMPLRYTVALDVGGDLRCPPAWVHLNPIEAATGNVIPLRAAGTRPMRTGGAA